MSTAPKSDPVTGSEVYIPKDHRPDWYWEYYLQGRVVGGSLGVMNKAISGISPAYLHSPLLKNMIAPQYTYKNPFWYLWLERGIYLSSALQFKSGLDAERVEKGTGEWLGAQSRLTRPDVVLVVELLQCRADLEWPSGQNHRACVGYGDCD